LILLPLSVTLASAVLVGEWGGGTLREMNLPKAPSVAAAPEHARPRLLAEKSGVAPGSSIWVALTFDIDKGWHLYWDGQNDSGQPVKAEWTLPEGVTIDALQWPTPKRGVYPNDVIDYIYEHRVTALALVTVADTVKPDTKLKISAKLKWLVCEEQCIPGKGEVSLEIPVIATDASPADASHSKLFTEARKTIPRPAKDSEGVVTRSWKGNTLVLSVVGASGLVFYPDSKCAPLSDAISQGESKRGDMTIDFDPHPIGGASESKTGEAQVSGILEVRHPSPKPAEYFIISFPKPPAK